MQKGLRKSSSHFYLNYLVCVCENLEGWAEKDYVSLEGSQSQRLKKLNPQSKQKVIKLLAKKIRNLRGHIGL